MKNEVVTSHVCFHPCLQNYNREPKSRGACGANDSAYGNSGPSGVVSAVGSLFPRGTKANVAAYGSDRGASCQCPGYQPSASTGPVGIGYYNRPGELTVACKNRHASCAFVWCFIRTENPWVGDSHSVYYQTFQVQVRAWKVGEVLMMGLGRLVSPRVQVFRYVLRRTRSVGNWVKRGLN
ncbi:hypothetical protein PIB30_030148 [Stylosanthes scabra]|uniref:Uncharacterized protein n=1 Tax=Stylosanthes scabra TaxID=79078 RepID=A0ABU6QC21_9FABA|nr:hypothetical protein [Stylosanthes scabra]